MSDRSGDGWRRADGADGAFGRRGGIAPDAHRRPLDTHVAIETPEHIVFDYRVAGPARRAVAYVLDLLLCYGSIALFATIVLFATMGGNVTGGYVGGLAKGAIGLVLLALFAAQWVYFVVFEGLYGRSPGKMALRLRVVTTTGRPIEWTAAALRNLLRTADWLPLGYVVGVVSLALSSKFQRLGDLVAGTMVVIPARSVASGAIELSPPATEHELSDLPERVTLDADERAAIELFLRRRHTLGRTRERELAAMIAPSIADRLGWSHPDPSRLLAIVHDRAANLGRIETAPLSSPPYRSDAAEGAR